MFFLVLQKGETEQRKSAKYEKKIGFLRWLLDRASVALSGFYRAKMVS